MSQTAQLTSIDPRRCFLVGLSILTILGLSGTPGRVDLHGLLVLQFEYQHCSVFAGIFDDGK